MMSLRALMQFSQVHWHYLVFVSLWAFWRWSRASVSNAGCKQGAKCDQQKLLLGICASGHHQCSRYLIQFCCLMFFRAGPSSGWVGCLSGPPVGHRLLHADPIDLCWYFKFRVRGTLSGFQALRAPSVPAARSLDGVEQVNPFILELNHTERWFFSLRFPPNGAQVFPCRDSLTLWAARALFQTNSFHPDDVCHVSARREGERRNPDKDNKETQRLIWSHSISRHYHSERRRPLRRRWLRMCYLRNCPFGKCLCCLKSKSSFSSMRSGGIVF